jgi:hypothetical protein
MDWGFSKKAQLHTTISTKIDVVNYSFKWMGVIYFLDEICRLDRRDPDGVGTSTIPD